MAYRKIYIAIDCADDTERDRVQAIFNELSNARFLDGKDLLNMMPAFDRNRDDLMLLFQMIKVGGVKSLMSVKGGSLIAKLARR